MSRLTDDDRFVLETARRVGADLRGKTSDRDRLAGWAIDALAAIITRLDTPGPPEEAHHE